MCVAVDQVVEESILLSALRVERQKSNGSAKLGRMVKKLVEEGVYPPQSKMGYSALRMVEYWGENWHEYAEPHNCPGCNADLRDLENGAPFKKEIALSDGDSVYAWKCPDCTHVWLRF